MVTLEERWTSAKAVVVDFHADRIREYDSMRFRYWLTWTPSIVNIYILYKPICLFRKQSYVIKLDKLKSINLLKSPEHSRRLRTLHTKSRRRHRLMPWCVPGFVRLWSSRVLPRVVTPDCPIWVIPIAWLILLNRSESCRKRRSDRDRFGNNGNENILIWGYTKSIISLYVYIYIYLWVSVIMYVCVCVCIIVYNTYNVYVWVCISHTSSLI